MTVKKEGVIGRYIGAASDTKPTTVPIGSTFLEYDEDVLQVTPDGTNYYPRNIEPIEFLFRPGQIALSSGMVESGTRTYNSNVASTGGAASTTVWSSAITYNPYKSGKIDGVSAGGVIYGQLTIGYIASATVGSAKLTARIQNLDGADWTTFLGLTATITTATTVAYKTYDISYLQTNSVFNSVPFSIAVGVQSDASANSIQARVMDSSYIMGEYLPGT